MSILLYLEFPENFVCFRKQERGNEPKDRNWKTSCNIQSVVPLLQWSLHLWEKKLFIKFYDFSRQKALVFLFTLLFHKCTSKCSIRWRLTLLLLKADFMRGLLLEKSLTNWALIKFIKVYRKNYLFDYKLRWKLTIFKFF